MKPFFSMGAELRGCFQMSQMIINTFSYLWSSTAIDAIAVLVDNGYKTFEVPVSSPHCWPDEISSHERAALRSRLDEYGAKIRSLNAGGYDINLASPGANMRRKSIEHIESVIDLAAAWDVPEVVISPGTRRPMISPSLEKTYGWMYESLENLIPLAKQAGTRLLFENTPYCFTPTIQDLAGVVSTINDDSVKIVYDVANAAYIGEDPVESLLSHHESIGLVHISDTGTDTWGHDPIGTGVIDWSGLGKAVKETCGVNNVVLEIIREENPVQEFKKAIQDLNDQGWELAN
jgi:L-ribulose-5-phosphate 3-epimerase